MSLTLAILLSSVHGYGLQTSLQGDFDFQRPRPSFSFTLRGLTWHTSTALTWHTSVIWIFLRAIMSGYRCWPPTPPYKMLFRWSTLLFLQKLYVNQLRAQAQVQRQWSAERQGCGRSWTVLYVRRAVFIYVSALVLGFEAVPYYTMYVSSRTKGHLRAIIPVSCLATYSQYT